jgi:hypothetical protein
VKRGIGLRDLLKHLRRDGGRPVEEEAGRAVFKPDLTTWAEIAGFLGVTERTAQLWHRDRGMPVGKLVGRVVASREELELWKNGSESQSAPERPSAPRRRTFGLAASSILLFAIAGLVWIAVAKAKESNLVRYKVEDRLLVLFDDRDKRAWNHLFETSQNYPEDSGWFFDLDGDGSSEFLFAEWGTSCLKAVHCFRRDGSIAWSVKPGRSVTNRRGQVILPSYRVETMARLSKPRADGGQLLILSHHTFSWPAQLLVLTPDGRPVAEYWHPGWLYDVTVADLNRDGVEEILLGGVNNSFRETGEGASLVVLDSEFRTSQGPVREGDWREVQGVPASEPLAVRVFPRIPNQPRNGHIFTLVERIRWNGERVVVRTRSEFEWWVEYHLNSRLEPVDFLTSQEVAHFIAPDASPEAQRRKGWDALKDIRIVVDRMNPPPGQATLLLR